MDNEIVLDDSVGYISVTAGLATVRLDLFEVNDRIADLHSQFKGRPHAEYAAAVQQLLVELGLPKVSVFAAGKFVREVVAACLDLKKKADLWPDSPASTASTPSEEVP